MVLNTRHTHTHAHTRARTHRSAFAVRRHAKRALDAANLQKAMVGFAELMRVEEEEQEQDEGFAVPMESGLIVLARWNNPALDTSTVQGQIQTKPLCGGAGWPDGPDEEYEP